MFMIFIIILYYYNEHCEIIGKTVYNISKQNYPYPAFPYPEFSEEPVNEIVKRTGLSLTSRLLTQAKSGVPLMGRSEVVYAELFVY